MFPSRFPAMPQTSVPHPGDDAGPIDTSFPVQTHFTPGAQPTPGGGQVSTELGLRPRRGNADAPAPRQPASTLLKRPRENDTDQQIPQPPSKRLQADHPQPEVPTHADVLQQGWTQSLQDTLPSSSPSSPMDAEMPSGTTLSRTSAASEYSDTDHSDSDDDMAYKARLEDPAVARSEVERNKRVDSTLVSSGYVKKLSAITERPPGELGDPDTATLKTMFAKGKRPVLRNGDPKPLFRKEAKFLHPSEKLNERTMLQPPTKQECKDLQTLNQRLSEGMAIEEAVKDLPTTFMVAQYRGMWYAPSKFSPEQRRQHRGLDELGQPIFSQAALQEGDRGIAGYYQLYNDPSKKSELGEYQQQLVQYGEQVRVALKALDDPSRPVTDEIKQAVTRPGGNWDPQTLQDVSVHFYSQDYAGFHQALDDAIQRRGNGNDPLPIDQLFENLPNSANPKVSTGDVPVHANKYSLGLKPYSGHEQDVLEPRYSAEGKPKHPYSGKVYTSIHPVTDYNQNGPTQLVPLQNEHRINISKMIIPERETQFDGMMVADRVAAQRKAKFPNFDRDYKEVNAQKYGMGREVFQAFSNAFESTTPGSDKRTYVESLLSSYLSRYADVRSVEQAQELAQQRGARLVYRTGPAEFGFEPPKIV